MIIKTQAHDGRWRWLDHVDRVETPELHCLVGTPAKADLVETLRSMHLARGEISTIGEPKIHEPDVQGNEVFFQVIHYFRTTRGDWDTLVAYGPTFLLNDQGDTLTRLR